MFAIVVRHYPHPEHADAFRDFCRRIAAELQGNTDGLLSIEGYDDAANDCLTIISRWDSAEHAQAGVARLVAVAAEVGPRNPAWSRREDELVRLAGF
jgi:quinol monooxygenase YgiN